MVAHRSLDVAWMGHYRSQYRPAEDLRSMTLKFFSSRELRNTPGSLWSALRRNLTVALTANGVPKALVISIEEGDLERALDVTRRVRAQLAASRMREDARRRGLDHLSAAEIDAEIRSVRSARAAE